MPTETTNEGNSNDKSSLGGGLFYSTVGLGKISPLVGPAHVLLVDFMVTEKLLGKIIKDLHLKEIQFDKVEPLLHQIQDTILVLKGQLQKDDEASRLDNVKKAKEEINRILAEVKAVATELTSQLQTAAGLAANQENKLLIQGASTSIEEQMKALQRDVDKTFAKLEPKHETHKLEKP